jgi:MFS family permease
LVEGNAKLEAVRAVSQTAGPTVAGVVIQALTAPVAVALDAASFAGSALLVAGIRRREDRPARSRDAHLRAEVMEGLRFVLGSRLLRTIAMSTGLSNLLSGVSYAMLIVLLARGLHLQANTIGVFFSIAAAGGLVGALVATRVGRRLGQGPTIWISQAACGLFGLALPLAQRGWLLWAVAFSYALGFVANVVYNVTQLSFRQGLTPEHLLGRMNATMRFLVWGTLPLGGLIGGVLGQLLGARPTLWVAAVGGLTPFLPLVFSALRTMRELPTWVEPEPAPGPVFPPP